MRRLLVTALARVFAFAGSVAGCSQGEEALFGEPTASLSCDMSGTWATFVEVGVGWQSLTIAAGAGTVRQWILSHRTPQPGGSVDLARSCGIGAHGVPLGSPWFATKEFTFADRHLPSEWTGVMFLPALFDGDTTPITPLQITLDVGDPLHLAPGNHLTTGVTPFSHGVEGLDGDQPWPDQAAMQPLVVDHDRDGKPGLTGLPFQGEVPGAPPGTTFSDPRLDLQAVPARASNLFMAIRTRAALSSTLVSCSPPRFEGTVLPSTLLIETRNVACTLSGTESAPCSLAQAAFIDANLPQFEHNGTSRVISVKLRNAGVSPESDADCAEMRDIMK